MKSIDFDRLKQICDENGFEFHVTDRDNEQISMIVQKIESFKATYIDWHYANNLMEINLSFKISNWDKAKDKDDIGEYLAKQLTKYLNNENRPNK